jgi:hypothetical protein
VLLLENSQPGAGAQVDLSGRQEVEITSDGKQFWLVGKP